jgi:hypothetical protein
MPRIGQSQSLTDASIVWKGVNDRYQSRAEMAKTEYLRPHYTPIPPVWQRHDYIT